MYSQIKSDLLKCRSVSWTHGFCVWKLLSRPISPVYTSFILMSLWTTSSNCRMLKEHKKDWRSHPSLYLKHSKHLWCLIRCKNLFKAGQGRFLLWKNMINGFASSNMEMRHCMCCVATKYPSNKHHVWTRQSHTAGLALLNSTIWCLPILYCRLFLN